MINRIPSLSHKNQLVYIIAAVWLEKEMWALIFFLKTTLSKTWRQRISKSSVTRSCPRECMFSVLGLDRMQLSFLNHNLCSIQIMYFNFECTDLGHNLHWFCGRFSVWISDLIFWPQSFKLLSYLRPDNELQLNGLHFGKIQRF